MKTMRNCSLFVAVFILFYFILFYSHSCIINFLNSSILFKKKKIVRWHNENVTRFFFFRFIPTVDSPCV